jgi:hypothetical protein
MQAGSAVTHYANAMAVRSANAAPRMETELTALLQDKNGRKYVCNCDTSKLVQQSSVQPCCAWAEGGVCMSLITCVTLPVQVLSRVFERVSLRGEFGFLV